MKSNITRTIIRMSLDCKQWLLLVSVNFCFFSSYFNIVPFAKMEFYRLTCADACQLCARLVHDPVSTCTCI